MKNEISSGGLKSETIHKNAAFLDNLTFLLRVVWIVE